MRPVYIGAGSQGFARLASRTRHEIHGMTTGQGDEPLTSIGLSHAAPTWTTLGEADALEGLTPRCLLYYRMRARSIQVAFRPFSHDG